MAAASKGSDHGAHAKADCAAEPRRRAGPAGRGVRQPVVHQRRQQRRQSELWFGNNGRAIIEPLFDGRTYGPNPVDYGDYNNPAVDSLIDRALASPDQRSAAMLWHQADLQIMRDAPIIPIETQSLPLFHSSRVHHATMSLTAQAPSTPDATAARHRQPRPRPPGPYRLRGADLAAGRGGLHPAGHRRRRGHRTGGRLLRRRGRPGAGPLHGRRPVVSLPAVRDRAGVGLPRQPGDRHPDDRVLLLGRDRSRRPRQTPPSARRNTSTRGWRSGRPPPTPGGCPPRGSTHRREEDIAGCVRLSRARQGCWSRRSCGRTRCRSRSRRRTGPAGCRGGGCP